MAKDLRITFLLDFYGDMLTEKQREVVECYYNEDLSLAEIARRRASRGRACATASSAPNSSFLKWKNGWVLQSASAACRKN